MSRRDPSWKLLERTSAPIQRLYILQKLCDSLQTPSDHDAAIILEVLRTQNEDAAPSAARPCFLLLARWARQLALRPSHSRDNAAEQLLLQNAIVLASQPLQTFGAGTGAGSAAALFLATAMTALGTSNNQSLETVAETIGVSLLSLTRPPSLEAMSPLIAAVGIAIPSLVVVPDAATWLFTALIHAASLLLRNPAHKVINALAPAYPVFRSAALSLLSSKISTQTAGVLPAEEARLHCLEGIYGILRTSVIPNDQTLANVHYSLSPAARSFSVLALGGLTEAAARTAHSQTSTPRIAQLLQGCEFLLHLATSQLDPSFSTSQSMLDQDSLVFNVACGLSLAQTTQSCNRPSPTPTTAACLVSSIAAVSLATDVLCEATHGPASTCSESLNVELVNIAGGALAQAVTTLTSAAVVHVGRARLSEADVVAQLTLLENAAHRVHLQYKQFTLHYSMPEINLNPLLSLLQRFFVACIQLLAAFGHRSTTLASRTRPNPVPLTSISVLEDLQFCRVQTSLYAEVLRNTLEALPLQADLAGAVAARLPSYAELETPARAMGGAPAWLVDGVTAAKLQLLFSALGPCMANVPIDIALDAVAPLAFLYLQHPHGGTRVAAHRALWSMFALLPQQHTEHLGPYYVKRCLEGVGVELQESGNSSAAAGRNTSIAPLPPLQKHQKMLQDVELLSQGLVTLFGAMQRPSEVAIACLESLTLRCVELAKVSNNSNDAELVAAVFRLILQQMFIVHYALVDSASHVVARCIADCPWEWQRVLCGDAVAMVGGSTDCVRKPGLVRWCQSLSSCVEHVEQTPHTEI